MLTNCLECGLQISDSAIFCPHCGFVFQPEKISKPQRRSTKRKRLPNGFGQITKITGKYLRKPYRVLVTVGKTPNGRPICKPLKPESYFETYNDAYAALVEYHKNPYDLDKDITLVELYKIWSENYFAGLKSDSSVRTITSAWAYCSSIYNMRVKDVRQRHIEGCMEQGTAIIKGVGKQPTAGVKARIKSLFNLMLDYAVSQEITDKNYSRLFEISGDTFKEIEEARREHINFSDIELDLLWKNVNTISYVDVVLIQCYSGWRPQELGLLELANINLEDRTVIGGMKTDAGTERVVPIHPKIFELVKQRYEEAKSLGSKYLLNCTDAKTHTTGTNLTYDKYKLRFIAICKRLNLNPEHKPHDGRITFVTLAKKYKVDEYAIKRIIGHKINDLTERVYTKRDAKWLMDEISKIP